MVDCQLTYLNFLFVQRDALDDIETRLLVRLGVPHVGLFEDHFVLGTVGQAKSLVLATTRPMPIARFSEKFDVRGPLPLALGMFLSGLCRARRGDSVIVGIQEGLGQHGRVVVAAGGTVLLGGRPPREGGVRRGVGHGGSVQSRGGLSRR